MQSRSIFFVMFLLSSLQLAQADVASDKLEQCNQAIAAGEPAKAIVLADDALQHDARDREALLCKGRAHSDAGQYPQALAAMQAAEQLSATPIDHIVALALTGNVHRSGRQHDKALQSYRQSLALAQAEKDKRFERINHNLIGETLVETNQLEAALDSYLAGGELAANDTERADNYARIAQTYSSLGKHDQAIEYQVKTVLGEERSGDFNRLAYASLELGRMHTVAADYANAEKVLNRIIARSRSQEAHYWEARGNYYMALEKIARGEPAEAKNLLTQAQQISKDIGADKLDREVGQALSKMQ